MQYYEVSPIKMIGTNINILTYHSKNKLKVGQIIEIPVGKKKSYGVVLAEVKKPKFKTKPVGDLVESSPLPSHLLKTAEWMHEYYRTPLPQVWQTILPTGLHKNRRTKLKQVPKGEDKEVKLTNDQKQAIDIINNTDSHTVMLHGVTGSGKTEVYIELIEKQLSSGKSCIYLVPEIALTPQTISRLSAKFEDKIVLHHSKMTESERHVSWKKCLESNEPLVVIGARSALFMPLQQIGLIVVDEAHETSYKQDQSPKYNALHVAAFMAKITKSKAILGTATPLLQDLFTAERSGAEIVKLSQRVKQSDDNKIKILDLKDKKLFRKNRFISDELIDKVAETIDRNRQTILFINRRGSASSVVCEHCGWVSSCRDCQMPLTFHADNMTTSCHVCNLTSRVPTSCPDCGEAKLRFMGVGTKRIESDIKKLFPTANVLRLDKDSFDADNLHKQYKSMRDGEYDIIIGTQMIAKGLDLPKVDTIGVILADSMLFLPDFSASEKTFQLIHQVNGRGGRHQAPADVYVQTFSPDHPVIKAAEKQDYQLFYESELEERKLLGYPPFKFLLKASFTRSSPESALKSGKRFISSLNKPKGVQINGPAPEFREYFRGKYRWHIIFKSSKRSDLLEVVDQLPGDWRYDLDPLNLL